MDNWTKYHGVLAKDGYSGSEVFTALFIFIGNFIFTNLFVGVICDVSYFISICSCSFIN